MAGNSSSGRPPHMQHSKTDAPTDYDGDPPWPREQLELMNERFVERLERAIQRGQEHAKVRDDAAH